MFNNISCVMLIAKNYKFLITIKPAGKFYKFITIIPKNYTHIDLYHNAVFSAPKFYNMSRILLARLYSKRVNSWRFQKFIKITITSKIYRLYINNNKTLIKSHLNYGHIIRTPILFVIAVKYSKYKMLFYGFNFSLLKLVALRVVQTRPYNIFTARGFRLKPGVVYKKVGKVSAYR